MAESYPCDSAHSIFSKEHPIYKYGLHPYITGCFWDMFIMGVSIGLIALGTRVLVLPQLYMDVVGEGLGILVLSTGLWFAIRMVVRTAYLLVLLVTTGNFRENAVHNFVVLISGSKSTMPILLVSQCLSIALLFVSFKLTPNTLAIYAIALSVLLLSTALYLRAASAAAPAWLRRAYSWATLERTLQLGQLLLAVVFALVVVFLEARAMHIAWPGAAATY